MGEELTDSESRGVRKHNRHGTVLRGTALACGKVLILIPNISKWVGEGRGGMAHNTFSTNVGYVYE